MPAKTCRLHFGRSWQGLQEGLTRQFAANRQPTPRCPLHNAKSRPVVVDARQQALPLAQPLLLPSTLLEIIRIICRCGRGCRFRRWLDGAGWHTLLGSWRCWLCSCQCSGATVAATRARATY